MASSYFQGRVMKHFAWLSVIVLTLTYLLAGLIAQPTSVRADQVTDRSITIGSSEPGATTSYDIEFTVADVGTESIEFFRVEFCDEDPLPNLDCEFDGSGDDVPDLDTATLNGTPTFDGETISLSAPTAGDHWLDFSLGLATDPAADTTFSVTVDDIVNPTNTTDTDANNTFYARLYVYDTTGAPADPSGGSTGPISPTAGQIHEGGVALSTAEQLTVTARVQEILEFCVGTNSTAPADCTTMSGNSVDMGVLDFTTVRSAVADEGNQGSVMVRTNAAGGVVVEYFAEQDNGDGKLKVTGTACTDNVSTSDQCINSIGGTQTALTGGTENFGLCVYDVDRTSSTGVSPTTNLDAAFTGTEYWGNTDCVTNGVAFLDDGSSATLATSTDSGGVVNDEMLVLDFNGTSDLTTPSGLYSVTLTFIGTATF